VLTREVTPPGTAQPDWGIAADLAYRLGHDLGLESPEQIWKEIEAVAPVFAGATHDLIHSPDGRDGVVVPLPGRRPAGSGDGAPDPWVPLPGRTVITPPTLDSYSLRLVVNRRLYDRGTLVSHSPSLAELGGPATLRLNPTDFDRLGVADGEDVRVTSSRGHITVPVSADASVPRGVAALPANGAGGRASVLVDASVPVTDVRVERP
jgi:predicted molibdopterin-dependent oxidoreductase YjgC